MIRTLPFSAMTLLLAYFYHPLEANDNTSKISATFDTIACYHSLYGSQNTTIWLKIIPLYSIQYVLKSLCSLCLCRTTFQHNLSFSHFYFTDVSLNYKLFIHGTTLWHRHCSWSHQQVHVSFIINTIFLRKKEAMVLFSFFSLK